MPESPRYDDFPSFILGITETIWERRQVHALHELYTDDLLVRSPASVVNGNRAVINATMATLAEFPDRELLGEDVIWARTGENSWLSSHRIFSRATHARDGNYGKADGRRLAYRVLADCHAEADAKWGWRINDEWLVRDQGAIVRQLGWTPEDFARQMIVSEGGACQKPFNPSDTDSAGAYRGVGNAAPPADLYMDVLKRLMSAEFSVINSAYDRACELEFPGGLSGHGWNDADEFWLNLRSAFPDAQFKIEHSVGRTDLGSAPRAAVRWSLHGRHSGWGAFGKPSGASVYILGISHAEFGPRGIRREFVIFDETAVWKQIIIHGG